MANYTKANLVKAQALMTQRFNSGELRYRQPATFLEFRRQAEIMIPSHKELRTREDRAVEVNYFARSARSLGTGGRTHNHTGVKGDSETLTPTWTAYDDKFKYNLKQADISVYDMESELANEFGQVVANFAEGLEAVASNYLFNNRSGVNTYARQGAFNATQDAFEITESTEGDRAVQITKSAMDFNKYQGIPYVFFCDTVAYDKFEKQANQGSGNSDNLSFQFSNIRFVKSIDLDASAAGLATPYTKGFWIAVPEGMIASLDWIPRQNRQGVSVPPISEYGTLMNPVDTLMYATHKYMEAEDGSASNGYTQDVKTEVEISIDLALEHAPLTTADETPLQAFALV
jgi:hypothetical protein